MYSITLRTIYEAFYVDTKNEIKIVTFNGFISSINPSTGLMERKCILSIQVSKERFTQINILNVDPKSCFKSLKGVSAAKLITLSPINPILSFNKNDKRFIAERQVNTDQGTNLAAMHWEDFEQLVRELFELEFAQNAKILFYHQKWKRQVPFFPEQDKLFLRCTEIYVIALAVFLLCLPLNLVEYLHYP